ncbi:MAG: hypothetical protein ACTTKL_11280 [Treponema sp.]
MKITGFFHGTLNGNQITLRACDAKDLKLIARLFQSKAEREQLSGREILLKCEIDAQFQKRSYKQLNAVWKLVTVIFESMENRKPTESERYDLYLDLLDVYADKTPNRLKKNELRPVHISEANTVAAARFIDGLLYHLATECSLSYDLQADVRSVLYDWEIWRGKQKTDFADSMSLDEWRKHAVYSEASGMGGNVDCHHIVSRGSAPQFANCAWNVLALTREEHEFFHRHGWDAFLDKYPHLRGKVERAFTLAGQLSAASGA